MPQDGAGRLWTGAAGGREVAGQEGWAVGASPQDALTAWDAGTAWAPGATAAKWQERRLRLQTRSLGLPADGDCEGLRRTGTRTDDLWPQASGLEDVEEGVTGGYGPCVQRSGT